MRLRWTVLAVTTITLLSVWLTFLQLSQQQSQQPQSPTPHRPARQEATLGLGQDSSSHEDLLVHLCICSDDPDFRPTVVAIRSAVAASQQAERFVFHFITTTELAVRFSKVAKLQLPGIRIEVHADEALEMAIQGRIEFRPSSGRKNLASAFNFAPFYLPNFLAASYTFSSQSRRLLYMDADIVILADLAELYDMDMQGRPCAAVPYCNQKLSTYINFKLLKELGHEGIDPDACIANRGLLLIDVRAWASMRLTESIEGWLEQYRTAEDDLWVGGMSQPPWLLAINGNYTHLADDWNCNSLGRHSMGTSEVKELRALGFMDEHLEVLRVESTSWGIVPYVVVCSNSAKLLHYNGAMKPWLLDSDTIQVPVCTMPKALMQYHFNWVQDVQVEGIPYRFVTCSEIWSLFLADDLLYSEPTNDTGSEQEQRRQDAKTWANKITQDREKRIKDREWREKVLAERRKKLAGGFVAGQTITASHDISVRGKVVVRKGCEGVVQGPSLNHPTERLNVLFKERRDKKTRSINVLPFEVKHISIGKEDEEKEKEDKEAKDR